MKLIQVIIEPKRLEAVKNALAEAEIFRFTISEVIGSGHQRAETEVGDRQVEISMFKKLKLEIAVNDKYVRPTQEAILKAAGTDVGAGKMLVFRIDDAIRIRTGEHGEDAI